MKKYFTLFIAFLILSYIASAQEPVCPDGFEQRDMYLTYSIPGYGDCDIYVVYCCKWDEATNTLTYFWSYIEATDETHCLSNITTTQGWQDFFVWLNEQLRYEAYSYCSPIPPCDEYTIISDYSRANCWYFENKLVQYPNEDVYRLRLRPCGYYNLCENFYYVCFDLTYHPPLLVKEFWYSQQTGSALCPTDIPELPPNGKTWDEYWITSCFTNPCR